MNGNSTLNASRRALFGILAACTIVMLPLVGWFIGTHSGGMLENMRTIDSVVMITANFHGPSYLDFLLFNISSKLIWVPLVIAIIYTFLKGGATLRQAVVLILVSVAIVAACDQLSGVVKRLVERPRPSHNDAISYLLHYVNNYHGGRYGFVSSHAANCFGMSVWLMLLTRNRAAKLSLFTLSALVCYSRIYLGVHYPLDVLMGACLGACTGTAAYLLCVRFMGRRACEVCDRRNIITWTVAATVAVIAAISALGVYL